MFTSKPDPEKVLAQFQIEPSRAPNDTDVRGLRVAVRSCYKMTVGFVKTANITTTVWITR